jgi:hypothetical protein
MAINQNHLFDDLDGVKCAIVEKDCKPERVAFLKRLLTYNHYTVIVRSTPLKAPSPAAPDAPPPPTPPETFIVYVTDVTFNATNAIFGRALYTPDGHTVTLKYWKQQESVAHDDVPYYA